MQIKSEIAGSVWKVIAQEGAELAAEDVIVILESMKMESEIKAHQAGTVQSILVKEGDSVQTGDSLVIIG